MNRIARMIVQDKLSKQGHTESTNKHKPEQDRASNDYASGYRDGFNDRANYEIRGEYDHEDGARRRSKTTGRYMRDRAELQLSAADLAHWEAKLKNADGTHGKHFDMRQCEEAAEKLGVRFDQYSEKEFCMTMNMLYSDLCEVCRAHVSPDKEAYYYAKMAQAWLEDDDGPPPAEKLALYYYCIVSTDE